MDINKLEDFMELVGRLKHLKRTGWVIKNIPEPETVAGHMYRMAMLAFLVEPTDKLDKIKVMQMALIHDLAECKVGDITPHCGVDKEEKRRREEKAMEEICEPLGEKGASMLRMFQEYEAQESPEARYVKDLDILDLIMQAYEYEKRDGIPGELEEFFIATSGKIRHPYISNVASAINEKRNSFCASAAKKK